MTWPNIFNLNEFAAAVFAVWAITGFGLACALCGRYYQPRPKQKGW